MFASRTLVWLAATVLLAALALSSAHPSNGAQRERQHVVSAGETLWAIAEESYGGDPRAGVWRIQQRNELGGTRLRPGQVLVLPPVEKS